MTVGVIAGTFLAGHAPQARAGSASAAAPDAGIAFPLHTSGASIVDARGNQQFVIAKNAAGYFTIASINSTDPVEVPGSSTAKGKVLDQSAATGGANQQWSFVSA